MSKDKEIQNLKKQLKHTQEAVLLGLLIIAVAICYSIYLGIK